MTARKTQIKSSNTGLEQLFGSKTRVKLLKLFLNSGGKLYFVREIARAINSQINSVRRELLNLEVLGLIREVETPKENYLIATGDGKKKIPKKLQKARRSEMLKKFFQVNSDFILFPELRALVLKADFLLEKSFVRALRRAGSVDYMALTGNFVGLPGIQADILIVGRFNRRRLARLVKGFEKDFGRSINYAVMSRSEFRYRKDITDRFLYSILENKKIVMVNQLDKI
jgi:predicted transcriptional regulator